MHDKRADMQHALSPVHAATCGMKQWHPAVWPCRKQPYGTMDARKQIAAWRVLRAFFRHGTCSRVCRGEKRPARRRIPVSRGPYPNPRAHKKPPPSRVGPRGGL